MTTAAEVTYRAGRSMPLTYLHSMPLSQHKAPFQKAWVLATKQSSLSTKRKRATATPGQAHGLCIEGLRPALQISHPKMVTDASTLSGTP